MRVISPTHVNICFFFSLTRLLVVIFVCFMFHLCLFFVSFMKLKKMVLPLDNLSGHSEFRTSSIQFLFFTLISLVLIAVEVVVATELLKVAQALAAVVVIEAVIIIAVVV